MALTLSQKERMILEDQKKHEQSCITKYTNYANQAKDPQLKQLFDANGQVEKTHLDSINQLLSGTVPQTGGQQGQSSSQSTVSQSSSTVGNTTASAGATLSDADMCTDLLMTEKFVSGAYDTAIFEFKDTQVRDVLNHIQKEEQQHGEAIFQYMESNGMYNVQ
jgi:spore coat protein CotF